MEKKDEPEIKTPRRAIDVVGNALSKKIDEVEKLQVVADIAAYCVIDLNANLSDAHREFMEGSLNNGAYQHVLNRHGRLLEALREAGYTELHPLFQYPIKPSVKTDPAIDSTLKPV